MRQLININENWEFIKENESEIVNLPHTWNGLDGQDGTNGYYRGRCLYRKTIGQFSGKTYIEVNGANTYCEVFVNGNRVADHCNGYGMFRAELTRLLFNEENLLEIYVDNSPNELFYPQTADFTFYGGLYRDVNLITDVAETHFALTDKSKNGIYITPVTDGNVFVKSFTYGYVAEGTKKFVITDMKGKTVAEAETPASEEIANLFVENPTLWHGMKNPYLYKLTATIERNGEILDKVEDFFGFRDIVFDSEKGCFLNGEYIKLKGVSRHQDREIIGNALTIKEHKEDLELIKEVGANSIRLAHYQQDSKMYDLCDQMGFLVWAEIPVISKYSKKKQAQARLMLEELIRQNYNHPSIYCWGVQNEISIGLATPGLTQGITELHNIAKRLDSTRPTASAQLAISPNNFKLNEVTDILGYNHYFGWYAQTCEQISVWLDEFHTEKPHIKLCLSEFGAEGITTLHTLNPTQGDYTEEYQAHFHEVYIKAINEREWLWGSYVWNMFDFGSAIRNEGGVRGRNNKGLVTIDRKTKKDSFYLYKAYWSDEKFVHVCGERFVDRPLGAQQIKVYSNCDEVTLNINGKSTTLNAEKIFVFDAEIIEGKNVITATSEKCKHTIEINGTDTINESYILPDSGSTFVRNWFAASDEIDESRLSLNDNLGEILDNHEVQKLIKNHLGKEIPENVSKVVGKLPLKPLSTITGKAPNGKKYVGLINQFLQSIEKDEE